MDERDVFNKVVHRDGVVREDFVRHFAAPLRPDGDCWTWAWNEAKERGARYVEGACWHSSGRFTRAHAWVEVDMPDGSVEIVECTEGYDDVIRYQGMDVSFSEANDQLGMLDANLATAIGMPHSGNRTSVIEAYTVTRMIDMGLT